jgi:hypothetical protein
MKSYEPKQSQSIFFDERGKIGERYGVCGVRKWAFGPRRAQGTGRRGKAQSTVLRARGKGHRGNEQSAGHRAPVRT